MNDNSELQINVEVIYRSIEELHTLLSVLEQQIQSGLFPSQLERKTVEIERTEERRRFD